MRRLAFALSALVLLPAAARADSFTITVTVNGITGSGILSGDSNGSGGFLITSISGSSLLGTSGTTPVTVLAPNDPTYLNDNMFYPMNSRLFDVSGLAFSGAFGSANLFSTVSGYELQGYDASGDFYDLLAAVSLSATTPEPSSVLLSFTGVLALAAFAFRKRISEACSAPATL